MRMTALTGTACVILLAVAVAAPASAATWRCSYLFDGDVAEDQDVEAETEAEAQQKLDEKARSEGWKIDLHLGCKKL